MYGMLMDLQWLEMEGLQSKRLSQANFKRIRLLGNKYALAL